MSRILSLVTLAVSVSQLACDELLEVDLEGGDIEVLVPRDGYTSGMNSVDFVWYPLAGATEYELIVAEPSLDSVDRLAARLRTTDLEASVPLPDGRYEWQLIAVNSISETATSPRTLVVAADTSVPDALLPVTTVSPVDGEVTNADPVRLLWSNSPDSGVAYRVQVATESFANSSFLRLDTVVDADFVEVDLAADGAYRWRVRPERAPFTGGYAEDFFVIDRTAPPTPSPMAPARGDIVDPPVRVEWSAIPGATAYEVEVRADSTDGRLVTAESVGFVNLALTDTLAERYFWRVAAADGVGNVSPFTGWWSYLLNE